MRYKLYGMLTVALVVFYLLAFSAPLRSDDPTSKFVPVQPLHSTLPASHAAIAVQLEIWDSAQGGTLISSEAHTVDTNGSSAITNDTGFPDLLAGRCTPQPCAGGLNPANFTAGSSRYLDVTQNGVSVLTGRVPLYATPFSLNPGPQGPAGPTGAQGPPGAPGVVQAVTASDASITVAGTAANPTVAVAANGITNAKVADGALSPAKITGTAATLGTNFFTGLQQINGLAGTGLSVGGFVGVVSNGSRTGVVATGGFTGVSGSSDSGTGVAGSGNTGVSGTSNSTNGTGVSGNGAIGVFGDSTNGIGVFGRGTTRGVGGTSTSPDGFGVLGLGINTGVRGDGDPTIGAGVVGNGNIGVAGTSTSNSLFGAGVVGNGHTTGVRGDGDPTTGTGVVGSGSTGVFGFSMNGTGVAGTSNSTTGAGVSGSGSVGVFGNSTGNGTGAGVFGLSTNATRPAIFGVNTVPVVGFAGLFSGNVVVSGVFSASVKAFKIDHPLDPGRKYLNHSTVESPDMKNMYDGVVTLGADGQGWVELPAYFEALNKDLRYQLTAIGAPAPNLYIAQEVHGNRFQIAGGQPGGKVSWQVTGIRQDPYAEKYRLPVEEEKPTAEQGYYMHPEVYDQPVSRSIDSLRIPAPPPKRGQP